MPPREFGNEILYVFVKRLSHPCLSLLLNNLSFPFFCPADNRLWAAFSYRGIFGREKKSEIVCMTLSLFGICFLKPKCTEAISWGSLEERENERNVNRKWEFLLGPNSGWGDRRKSAGMQFCGWDNQGSPLISSVEIFRGVARIPSGKEVWFSALAVIYESEKQQGRGN